MGGNAVFSHLVHFTRADLHLDRPVSTNHRRMQRLIAIGFGQADVVLEAAWNGPEGVVHHRQGPVAAIQIRAEDPQGRHVVDLVECLLLALHLAPDAIEVLGAAAHLTVGEPHRRQPIA